MGLTLITKCFWLEAKATNKRSIMSFRCSSLDQIITEKRIHCALVHLASVLQLKSILVAMFTFTTAKRHIPSQDLIASTLEILSCNQRFFSSHQCSLACIRTLSRLLRLPDSYCSIKQWIDTPHQLLWVRYLIDIQIHVSGRSQVRFPLGSGFLKLSKVKIL